MRALKRMMYFLTSRLFLTSLLILLQIFAFLFPFLFLGVKSIYIHTAISFLSTILAIAIANDERHAPFHLTWILLLLTVPIMGWPLYILLRHNQQASRACKRCEQVNAQLDAISIGGNKPESLPVCKKHPFCREMTFLANASNAPVYTNTTAQYFANGEVFFPVYLEKLRAAKRFIFMEYFIISDGTLWQSVREILLEKLKQGVEIRILYDDIATISKLPNGFCKELRSHGVQIYPFNPYRAAVNSFMNYRDHRKITVIDGQYAFTGGINLADEYINAIERFGHWKDCAVLLEGEAAQALTHTFLKSWGFAVKAECNPQTYLSSPSVPCTELVQPFADSPADDLRVGRCTYMNLIQGARRYLWITTPYLIPDEAVIDSLCLAAGSGIDVRIITPHIPDKWYVHAVTRSNYLPLIRAGVRVYEYTPGFIHAKLILTDDEACMVATTNLDYRSFFSLFENGTMLYGKTPITQVRNDFMDTLTKCQRVTLEECKQVPWPRKLLRAVLRVFSPFL